MKISTSLLTDWLTDTDCEESEDKKRRKKCGGVACQKSKIVDGVLHPCGPVTRPGYFHQTNYYKSSPLRKSFVILTFPHGDKWAHCRDCNLAFLHCVFKIFALCVILFSMFAVWI